MVPHTWILKCLQMFGLAKNVISLMETDTPSWKIKLYICDQLLRFASI